MRRPVDCFCLFSGRCFQSDEYNEHGDDLAQCYAYSSWHIVEWQEEEGQAQCEDGQSSEAGETVVQILVSPISVISGTDAFTL